MNVTGKELYFFVVAAASFVGVLIFFIGFVFNIIELISYNFERFYFKEFVSNIVPGTVLGIIAYIHYRKGSSLTNK